jgi:hypothetical protein
MPLRIETRTSSILGLFVVLVVLAGGCSSSTNTNISPSDAGAGAGGSGGGEAGRGGTVTGGAQSSGGSSVTGGVGTGGSVGAGGSGGTDLGTGGAGGLASGEGASAGIDVRGGASSGGTGGVGGLAGGEVAIAGMDGRGGSSGGAAGSAGSTAVTGGAPGTASLAFATDRVIVTGVRGTSTPPATTVIQLHNGGQAPVQITSLTVTGTDQALFKVTAPSVPATLAAGADIPVTVQLLTTSASLPPAPSNKDKGGTLLTGTLTASSSAGTAQAVAYGLVMIQANYEATLGQILTTLGYKITVGRAQDNWNPNTSMDAKDLPGVEVGTDEVAAKHFVKAGAGNVTLTVIARFSPYGALPYGWYPSTSSTTRNVVGTMAMITDAQTNNKARMVLPPLVAGTMTTFDPGSAPFGLWVYTDQVTQKYESGGKAANGDYNFSDDALNSPANAHRFKTYQLKDASGTVIAQSYLVAVEEAGNGDYQDYVYLLGNVKPAP